MLNKDVLDKTKHYLGELTAQQEEALNAFLELKLSEPELIKKLGIAEEKVAEFLTALNKEKAVFRQEISEKELATVAGGNCFSTANIPDDVTCGADNYYSCDRTEMYDDPNNCHYMHTRNIHGGNGFPNCAATVESGSFCARTDACYHGAVDYQGMTDCSKAWK